MDGQTGKAQGGHEMKGIIFVILIGLGGSALAQTTQPYAGLEAREIASMSDERIAGLRSGAGLGYAQAAELNGWPGPLHVLQIADELELEASTRARIEAIYADMRANAMRLGEALISAEAQLDALFDGQPSAEKVSETTQEIGRIEAELRAVHLNAHLATTPLLTHHQRMIYTRARGYRGGHATGHGGHN
jgi:Spy/CpxP family protein refolding chaperone